MAAGVEQSHAKSGTAIVLDPRTGEILALANAPTFDPNSPGAAKSETRINQALEYDYEPGSTFKIVAYSAAIEKGLVKPEDKIDCQMGSITVAKRIIHDHHPFGVLTVAELQAVPEACTLERREEQRSGLRDIGSPDTALGSAPRARRHAIRSGGVIAFPTDTVYGLGAAADDEVEPARPIHRPPRQRWRAWQ